MYSFLTHQDWSSGWRLKKKEMEEAIQQKNLEIQQFMDDLQVRTGIYGS